MDIPSLFMIPSAVSSGKVHSVFPNSTDADFDFNRDSDATRVNSEGLIERVGYYGSELVTDGDFSSSSNWYIGTGCSISNGQAIFSSASSGSGFTGQNANANICTIGKTYKVTFTIVSISEGGVKVRFPFNSSNVHTEAGTYTEYGVSTNAGIYIQNSGTTTAVIDNVSVVEVTGDRARLNYEIEGGLVNTKPSLLLEPQSSNLIPYSNPIEVSGGWQIFDNASIETNYEISPMGIKNASLVGTQGGVNDFIFDSITISNSATYTVSFYIKNIDSQATGFYAPSAVDGRINWNGAEISSIVGTGANYEELSNGWYRVHQTTTSTSTNVITRIYSDRVSTGSVLIFGYQLEEQSYPTSLIPTNGSTQTRSGETCNGAGTSSIFESSEGILYAEYASLANDGSVRYLGLSDGSSGNRAVILNDSTTNNIRGIVSSGGTKYADFGFVVSDVTTFNKVALKWKANDFQLWINGVKRVSDSAGPAPIGLNRFGFDLAGSGPIDAKIRDIRVYNTKEMTDSEVDILLTKITS